MPSQYIIQFTGHDEIISFYDMLNKSFNRRFFARIIEDSILISFAELSSEQIVMNYVRSILRPAQIVPV